MQRRPTLKEISANATKCVVFLSFGRTDPLMKTLLSSSLILVFPFVTPLKRHSRQMLAGFSFNETRLPESECWQCLSKAQCEAEWLSGPRSHRGGRPWPRSCLPLSPINSNCLLQLFTGTMSDVFLYSRRPQTPNRRFYHADKGQKGRKKKPWKDGSERDDQMASRSVGGVNPLRFASPEWLFNAPLQNPDTG